MVMLMLMLPISILPQPGDDVCRDYEACDGDDSVVNVDNYDDNDDGDIL